MSINIRQKGQEGEREIQRVLEPIVRRVMQEGGYVLPDKPIIQRNQNQSAVGGSDLSNTFGLCIEVKRQETLSVNTWWEQCRRAAVQNNETPVLLYRQNGKKWRCVVTVELNLPVLQNTHSIMLSRAEIGFEEFQEWFAEWVRRSLLLGVIPRV